MYGHWSYRNVASNNIYKNLNLLVLDARCATPNNQQTLDRVMPKCPGYKRTTTEARIGQMMVDDCVRYVLEPSSPGRESQHVHINDSLYLKRGADPSIRLSNVSAGCKVEFAQVFG